MGQLTNPIGFRIGRGKGNYVWSKNASFFYNRSSYKRIIVLFRYLSLIIKKFGIFLRRLYRRPLFTARPTYNMVGFGDSKTLIIGLPIFDYFSALRRMPARAWSRYPRTPRWGRLKPRELRRFIRFKRNRRKGGRYTIVPSMVKNTFRSLLPIYRLRFLLPTLPVVSLRGVRGRRGTFIRLSSPNGKVSLFRIARRSIFEYLDTLLDPRWEPKPTTVRKLLLQYLFKAVVNTALYIDLARSRRRATAATVPTPPQRATILLTLSRMLSLGPDGRRIRRGRGGNRGQSNPRHRSRIHSRPRFPSSLNFNRGRYAVPLRFFRHARFGARRWWGRAVGLKQVKIGRRRGNRLYQKKLRKFLALPYHLRQIRRFRMRRRPFRNISRYIQFSRLGYRLTSLGQLYIQSVRRGAHLSFRSGRRRRLDLLPLHPLLSFMRPVGPGYDFLLRTFIFKARIFARLSSKFWFYAFQLFFHRVFDGLMEYGALSQITLQLSAIRQLVSAYMLAVHLTRELRKGFKVPFVFRQIRKGLRLLIREKRLFAYKLMFTGRFDRRQMATYYWRSEGPLSFNTAGAKLDHASRHFVAKYGLCAVKVWLSYR